MNATEKGYVKNISLTNVNLQVLGGGKMCQAKLLPSDGYPECSNFKLPCYGMFVKNVQDLKLNNVNYQTKKPDERPAEIIE